METPQIEVGTQGNSAEAFFLSIEQDLASEEAKLAQMDGDKTVSKEEYKQIQKQAKLVSFLKAMKESATLYGEAVSNNDVPLESVMKKYLNI